MPTLQQWLDSATHALREAGIPSARLDSEIILAHTLRKSRTYIHGHNNDMIDPRHHEIADARLRLRLDRTPIAYIIGHKEFYGRLFKVSPATLIPRPETEAMIMLLEKYIPHDAKTCIDVGTGSGILGITAKLEYPYLAVTLIDNSRHALNIAATNAKHLAAEVSLLQSDLLSAYPMQADIILANLPYVDPAWQRSPETEHEPPQALFANNYGLKLIKQLIKQLPSRLRPGSLVLIEADQRQHASVLRMSEEIGLTHLETQGLIMAFTLSSPDTPRALL